MRTLLLKSDESLEWPPVHTTALDTLKSAAMQNTTLAYADISKPFIIYVDASTRALSYALDQEMPDGLLEHTAFSECATSRYEKHLRVCLLELPGLCAALSEYNPYISNGLKFIVRSDHMSLRWLEDLKNVPTSKLIRCSLLLRLYDFDLQHVSGTANGLRDSLSQCEYPVDEAEELETPVSGIHSHQYLNSVDNVQPADTDAMEQSLQPIQVIITLPEAESEQSHVVHAQHDIDVEPDTEAVIDSQSMPALL